MEISCGIWVETVKVLGKKVQISPKISFPTEVFDWCIFDKSTRSTWDALRLLPSHLLGRWYLQSVLVLSLRRPLLFQGVTSAFRPSGLILGVLQKMFRIFYGLTKSRSLWWSFPMWQPLSNSQELLSDPFKTSEQRCTLPKIIQAFIWVCFHLALAFQLAQRT